MIKHSIIYLFQTARLKLYFIFLISCNQQLYAIFWKSTIVNFGINKNFVLDFLEQKWDIFLIDVELNWKKAIVEIDANDEKLKERIIFYLRFSQ